MKGRAKDQIRRRRYGTATVGIVCVLLFYVTLSWLELNALRNNTNYRSAFGRLVQATANLELEIHRAFLESRVGSARGRYAELEQAFNELVIIFSALRAADEDGIAEEGETAGQESDEQAWDQLAHALGDDVAPPFELGDSAMPDHLVEIWEAGTIRGDSLESMIGDLLEQSRHFVRAKDTYGKAERRAVIKLDQLIDERIHPTFHEVSTLLERESEESVNMIFTVLVISAFAIAIVALINVLTIYAPAEQD